MHLPPQEDWSPELLSVLQSAVPALEGSALDEELEDGELGEGDGLDGWGSVHAAGVWPGSGTDASGFGVGSASGSGRLVEGLRDNVALRGGHSGEGAAPGDLLSQGAMALPMSTLTSGKRRTYPNRSTFQAHVCCVMDPMQVPRVLETLQGSPHLSSAGSWPYAYRIISPFDGQTHEGSNDDNDLGAGERMLGLLQRMGLENLLLVASRWDSGPRERLGTELFRCINQQCKDLLRELQQAVRASFPPEELLGPGHQASMMTGGDADGISEVFGAVSEFGSDFDTPHTIGTHEMRGDTLTGAPQYGPQQVFDFRSLGRTPPPELLQSQRGVVGQPPRRRRAAAETEVQALAGEAAVPGDLVPSAAAACGSTLREPAVQQCGTSVRESAAANDSLADGGSASNIFDSCVSSQSPACEPVRELSRASLLRLSDDDLLRLGGDLRKERRGLEEKLIALGEAEGVVDGMDQPIFKGGAVGDRLAMRTVLAASSAQRSKPPPSLTKRKTQMLRQPELQSVPPRLLKSVDLQSPRA